MKGLLISLISVYQKFISPMIHQLTGQNMCRYTVTCSEYAKIAFSKYGVIKGGQRAIKRFLSCQPFSKTTYANL